MSRAHQLLKELQGAFVDSGVEHPYTTFWFDELKEILDQKFPQVLRLQPGAAYRFKGKRGMTCVGRVTKENQKTWVLYEVEGSSRPGCRWMIHKTWCTPENMTPVKTESQIPEGVKIK